MVALLRCTSCRTALTRDLNGEQLCPRCGTRMTLVGISRGVERAPVRR